MAMHFQMQFIGWYPEHFSETVNTTGPCRWYVSIGSGDGISSTNVRQVIITPYDIPRGQWVNTLRPRQDGRHFPDDIFKCIFFNENVWILIKISLKFNSKGPVINIPSLVQIMAWRLLGDKPLSEPMIVRLSTHICVTRPQWVNIYNLTNPNNKKCLPHLTHSRQYTISQHNLWPCFTKKKGYQRKNIYIFTCQYMHQ